MRGENEGAHHKDHAHEERVHYAKDRFQLVCGTDVIDSHIVEVRIYPCYLLIYISHVCDLYQLKFKHCLSTN